MATLRAFLRSPSGWVGVILLLAIVGLAVFAPIFLHHRATAYNPVYANLAPSGSHWLGTDQLGRDILARLLVATRLTLGLAVAATAAGAAAGMLLGTVAAALPRVARNVALRVIDALIAFPALLICIFVIAIIGPGFAGAVIGVALATAFGFARIASSLSLSIAGRDFVAATRLLGVSFPRLVVRYILPNIGEALIITATVSISSAIVALASLSFIGLGVQPPAFDWGSMLTSGVNDIYENWAAAMGPLAFIAISALAFGYAGEGYARALNPVLWSRNRRSGAAVGASAMGLPRAIIDVATESMRSSLADLDLQQPSLSGNMQLPAQHISDPAGEAALESKVVSSNGHNPDAVLEVRNLGVGVQGSSGNVQIVQDVSFALRPGETLGVVGESGSGKTTVAMAIAQLLADGAEMSGEVWLKGERIDHLSDRQKDRLCATELAVIFQDPMTSLNPALKIGRQLTERSEVHGGMRHRAASALAEQMLGEVHVPAPRRQLARHPHELSGGMRQRVMIAMGLMTRPAVLIADEPTTALDVTIQAQIMDLMRYAHDEYGTAVILISHNIGLITQNCDHVIVMYSGRVVENASISQLTSAPRHPYTKALLGAVPTLSAERGRRFDVIPGEISEIGAVINGCPFHPRCSEAVAKCREVRPMLRRAAEDTSLAACHVANGDT